MRKGLPISLFYLAYFISLFSLINVAYSQNDAQKLVHTAHRVTVNLGNQSSLGSGTAIGNWHILTCRHLFDENKKPTKITTYAQTLQKEFTVKHYHISEKYDLALLYLDQNESNKLLQYVNIVTPDDFDNIYKANVEQFYALGYGSNGQLCGMNISLVGDHNKYSTPFIFGKPLRQGDSGGGTYYNNKLCGVNVLSDQSTGIAVRPEYVYEFIMELSQKQNYEDYENYEDTANCPTCPNPTPNRPFNRPFGGMSPIPPTPIPPIQNNPNPPVTNPKDSKCCEFCRELEIKIQRNSEENEKLAKLLELNQKNLDNLQTMVKENTIGNQRIVSEIDTKIRELTIKNQRIEADLANLSKKLSGQMRFKLFFDPETGKITNAN